MDAEPEHPLGATSRRFERPGMTDEVMASPNRDRDLCDLDEERRGLGWASDLRVRVAQHQLHPGSPDPPTPVPLSLHLPASEGPDPSTACQARLPFFYNTTSPLTWNKALVFFCLPPLLKSRAVSTGRPCLRASAVNATVKLALRPSVLFQVPSSSYRRTFTARLQPRSGATYLLESVAHAVASPPSPPPTISFFR